MANLILSQSYNFMTTGEWDWIPTEATQTKIVIAGYGHKQVFQGSFSVSDSSVSGSVSSTQYYFNNTLIYSVTGMATGANNATTLQQYAETSGNAQSTFAYVLSGIDSITGSSSNDILLGYAGSDYISGMGGSDALYGGAGNDNLNGGAGNDTLIGGAGNDALTGGAGNDIYKVALTTSGVLEDTIIETSSSSSEIDALVLTGASTNTAASTITLSSLVYVEKVDASGTGLSKLNLTGNQLANTLTGNTAANSLIGGAGNDVLRGGAGNDVLRGGTGNDVLYGGTGQDVFRFDAALTSSTLQNLDQIKDFVVQDDSIQLENSIFTKLGATATGTINSAYFKQISTGGATDSNDYIVYNKTTGALFYDADGGADGNTDGIQIATIGINLTTLAYTDFSLV